MGRLIRCQTGEVFTEYRDYLKSRHWKNVKRRYYAKYEYVCVKCGWNKGIQLHHLHYRNIGHERLEDLQALCRRCHMETHGLLPKVKKKWRLENKIIACAVIAWVIIKMWFYGK